MSSPLSTDNRRPSPEFLSRIPPFKKGGLLPRDWQEVNKNYRVQQRVLEQAHEKEEQAAVIVSRNVMTAPLPSLV